MGQMIQQTIKRPLSPMRVIRISLALFLFLIFTILISMLLGTADVTIVQFRGILTGDAEVKEMTKLIVLNIRLPRIMSAGLAGFSLSLGVWCFRPFYEIRWPILISWAFPAAGPSVRCSASCLDSVLTWGYPSCPLPEPC